MEMGTKQALCIESCEMYSGPPEMRTRHRYSFYNELIASVCYFYNRTQKCDVLFTNSSAIMRHM